VDFLFLIHQSPITNHLSRIHTPACPSCLCGEISVS
jgi:hypothetical protein